MSAPSSRAKGKERGAVEERVPTAAARSANSRRRAQSVIITLTDGRVGRFTGPELVSRGDRNCVQNIVFTDARLLPDDCHWEEMKP